VKASSELEEITAVRLLRVNLLRPAAVILIGLVAFFLLGPYSYLAGAIALDMSGSKAGAASSGIVDGSAIWAVCLPETPLPACR